MELSFKEISPVDIEVSGKIQWDELKDIYERELAETAKTVKIAGFRVGNAPRELVERRHGEEIKSKTITKKIYGILEEETRKKGRWLEILRISNLVWNETDSVVSFSLKIEVVPRRRIDLDVQVKRDVELSVSEDELRREIALRKERAAVLERSEKEELKGEEDEIGVFDISIRDISTQRLVRRSENDLLDISRSEEWFRNAVIGMKRGQRREVVVDGTRKVIVFLKDIRKKVLPSDEDLAKALGYSSETEMLEDVRKKILEAKRALMREQIYVEVIGKIAEKNNLAVPRGLMERFLSEIVSSDPGISRDDAQRLAIFKAVERVVLANVMEDHDIQVTESELDNYITSNFGSDRLEMLKRSARQDIELMIKLAKAKSRILEMITI